MGKNPDVVPKECILLAKAAALHALEIDSTLAHAHSALADSLAIYDREWAESDRHFRKALELDPNISDIHVAFGASYLFAVGRVNQSVSELEKAIQLEPVSLINNAVAVSAYMYARQFDKALCQARAATDLDPNLLSLGIGSGLR